VPRSSCQHSCELEGSQVEWPRSNGDLRKRRRPQLAPKLADQDTALTSGERGDGCRAAATAEQPIERARRPTTLNVPECRDANVEAELGVTGSQLLGYADASTGDALGNYDDRM
jgi:hypothetical protein